MNRTSIYAVFHLNLAFSSIKVDERAKVIQNCYWPLLEIIKKGIPLGIELTGFTLNEIQRIDNAWVTEFKQLLSESKCELIASGQSQLIGPLVPWQVNQKNLEIGLQTYSSLLSHSPKIAYINEQAYSSSLLDIYIDMGFKAFVMEWDNAATLHPEWPDDVSFQPSLVSAHSGRSLPVIWNLSVNFQKLQRVCHQEIDKPSYFEFIRNKLNSSTVCMPIYGNDAEVFNYRPGRFDEEKAIAIDEWKLLEEIFLELSSDYQWIGISETLEFTSKGKPFELTTSESPIVVKKQNKYNINRWALSGRDDLQLNSLCYDTFKKLAESSDSEEKWKTLCECWGSDYRTHTVEKRFQENLKELYKLNRSLPLREQTPEFSDMQGDLWQYSEETRFIVIESNKLRLVLNHRKGGSIHQLHFHKHKRPIIGTIEHGSFKSISLTADFFSNHLIAEIPNERARVTDLASTNYFFTQQNGHLELVFEFTGKIGYFRKVYSFKGSDSFSCRYEFQNKERPIGFLRLASLTLLNTQVDSKPIFQNHMGGKKMETCILSTNFSHGNAVSTLVSSSNCAGASSGQVIWGIDNENIRVNWNPGNCSAIPMLHNQIEHDERLSRLYFSLSELDDTLKDGGKISDFEFTISAE